MASEKPKTKVIAENRRAKFDYFLEEYTEAGIQLLGTEIKALRDGRANIAEAYAAVEGREIVLVNADIPPYKQANRFNHEPRRHRKLLLHRKRGALPRGLHPDDDHAAGRGRPALRGVPRRHP